MDFTPNDYTLSQNFPNPFNPTTTIQFQVPEAGEVSIVIYDMLGQVVKELFAENVQAGKYSVDWNGVNNSGLKMSSGSYIYRMTAGNFIETKEMILLK
jgi:flagellar hook assembly protein FlgD